MTVRAFLAELYRRDPLLALTGWAQVAVLAVVLVIAPFDDRTVLGLNPWIKPSKFLVSVAIYVWTVAWFLDYLRDARWARRTISGGVAGVMVLEIACIVIQSMRGVRSHFNDATAFDQIVFGLMGLGIAVNTVLLAMLGLLLLVRHTVLPRPYLWAVRLGVLLILLGSADGFVMIANGAHAVGVPDGGAGLPYVNWSTEAGDLRVAHGLGLHGFQILPLFAFGMSRARTGLTERGQVGLVFGFAAAYVATGTVLFLQAMTARPLLSFLASGIVR